jgi:NADPH:quinone reductase-like Zn-dependent oxidoreductase
VRAVQLKEFTQSPGSVTVSEVPQPSPRPGEVLVRVEAAAINPSDLVNIRGGFPMTKLPRVIGRDFAGRVVQGPPHLLDRKVWGAGGSDLGLTRDGTHAELIALPEDAVALRPHSLSSEDAAASGIPYITAWLALVERAAIKRGDWVLVSGAAGSVGTAAVEIARYVGARAIALGQGW